MYTWGIIKKKRRSSHSSSTQDGKAYTLADKLQWLEACLRKYSPKQQKAADVLTQCYIWGWPQPEYDSVSDKLLGEFRKQSLQN